MLLKNICKPNEIGKYGIPASAEDYDESKVRYLRISDIDDFGKLLDKDKKSVSATDINKYILEENDIVVARTGNSTGRTYFHEKKNGILAFAGFLIKYGLDNNKVNPKYLKYYTISSEYKQWVKNLSVGSTRGNINAQTFANCPILLPERKQQNFLVSILSLLDDKIELNNRINDNLEQMAKTLYDYWFLQFDFPDENGRPYKSSGGKMVWNEVLKREIPISWEVRKISQIAKTGSGGTPKSTEKDYYENGDVPWINSGELNNSFIISTNNYITELGMKNSNAKLFPRDTILMAMYGATAGKTSILSFEATTNQAICAVMPLETEMFHYTKFVLDDLYKYLINLSTGSARDNLSQDKIRELNIIVPNNFVLNQHSKMTFKYFEKIRNNLQQNQQLNSLRDWLLPMLMNGQVKVE